MSTESAKKFLDIINFAKVIENTDKDEKKLEFAKKAGFDFTLEELEQVKSELSDDDLDNVAGGRGPARPPQFNANVNCNLM